MTIIALQILHVHPVQVLKSLLLHALLFDIDGQGQCIDLENIPKVSPKEYIEQRQKSQKISTTTVHRPDEGQRSALQQPGALRPG